MQGGLSSIEDVDGAEPLRGSQVLQMLVIGEEPMGIRDMVDLLRYQGRRILVKSPWPSSCYN